MKTRVMVITALLAIAWLVPVSGASAHGAVVIPFDKEVTSGPDPTVWVGYAGAGGILTTLAAEDVRPAGSVWHVQFGRWGVFDSGTECDDFAANLGGIVNLVNGRVSLNGTVVGGDCEGAHIHVQAQLDLNDFSSQGTMRITP